MKAERKPGEPFRILFVCTGNTCRSPMAEAIARRTLDARGWTGVEVRSAGVAAGVGAPASAGAARVAARRGLDLADHRSAQVGPTLLEWADLVLTMTPAHLAAVVAAGAGEKAALLTDFAAGEGGAGVPVADPFGGPDEVYEETFTQLEELVEQALDRLAPHGAP